MTEQISALIKALDVLQLDTERLMLEISRHRDIPEHSCAKGADVINARHAALNSL